MLDLDQLKAHLTATNLSPWLPLLPTIRERLQSTAHGDMARWQEALTSIRADGNSEQQKAALLDLSPWRKGPFALGDIVIDAEWRSDLKWQRMADKIAALDGRKVLDVGCGNGFYALRMRTAGADTVIGVDPTLLYVMQFLAVNCFARDERTFVLPLRMHELPTDGAFDTTFSMGVLYHQRSPIDHLRQLRDSLRHGGQLVLETIYLPGDEAFARTPKDRYARMKNVWLLPSLAELETWLSRSGFRDMDVIDTSVTTTDEQRSTEWMTFESLAEALDKNDSSKTIEGWPAPHRVVVTATKP